MTLCQCVWFRLKWNSLWVNWLIKWLHPNTVCHLQSNGALKGIFCRLCITCGNSCTVKGKWLRFLETILAVHFNNNLYTNLLDRGRKSGHDFGNISASLDSLYPTHSPQIWDTIHLQLDRILAWQWTRHSCLQLHSKEITCYRPYISGKIFVAVRFLGFHLVSCKQYHTLKGHPGSLSLYSVMLYHQSFFYCLRTNTWLVFYHTETRRSDVHLRRAQ